MYTREQPSTDDSFSTIALIERDPAGQERPSRLRWWYRIAAPPAPMATASLREREGLLTVAIFADLLYTFLIFWTRRRKGQWRRQNKSKSCFD